MGFHRYIEPEPVNYREVVLAETPTQRLITHEEDFVPTPPVGTYVAMVFRVTGHDRDCDGSAMMRLEAVGRDDQSTGWAPNHLGAYADSMVIVDRPQDLWDAIEEGP